MFVQCMTKQFNVFRQRWRTLHLNQTKESGPKKKSCYMVRYFMSIPLARPEKKTPQYNGFIVKNYREYLCAFMTNDKYTQTLNTLFGAQGTACLYYNSFSSHSPNDADEYFYTIMPWRKERIIRHYLLCMTSR